MESFEEPGLISRENLLEVPTLSDSPPEEEDVKATLQPRFSPSPRRRNSDSSEEMELEAPSTVTRKVSFADAFGFDLVSVKEFHSWDVPNTSPNDDLEDEVVAVEEFYLTPLFTLPATEEELLQKVRAQKLWLESVEFLPGITCMKGTIRVLNVSFQKLVYVRMSLDSWLTYYDILGEYVPNSCDGETDQFLFKITLVPPYQRDGTKVEFCIRYETSVGIFWANNDNQNYILICHKKETKQPETSLEPKQAQEEITDKHLKGCLKATPNSKEEILATADEDIWNDFRTSESDVPKILYSYVDDNEIERNKEKAKSTKVKHPEDDNENEKELELLLGQHFTSTAGCSRDERSLDTTEPVRFQNEPREFGDKVDSGLLRQPLPISSSSEHALQNKELHSKEMYSAGDEYSQSSPEKLPVIDSANITAVPSECFTPSESILSPEYQFGAKQNEAAKNEEVFLTKHGTCPADVQKDESRSPPGSKTIEELFISADDYDHHETVWEARPKGVPLEHSEGIQLRGEVSEVLNDNAKPFQEQQMKEISSQILSSTSESTAKNEPEGEMFEHKNKEYFRGELNTNNIAYDNVTIHCLRSSDAEDEIVEGKYKTEFNVDKSKEIKLSILEQSPEEEQVYSTVGHGKHCTQDSNEMTRTEGKAIPDQDLYLKTTLKSSREFPQSLYNEAAEEGSMWEKFHHGSAKTENKVPPADINIAGSCYESPSVTSSEESVEAHTAEGGEIMPPYTYASVEMMAGSGCDSNETNEMSHTIIPNLPLEGQLSSSEHGERSIGQFSHQLEFNEGKLLGPTIVISEPAEEKEETRSETEGLGTEIKQNIEGHENLDVSDPGEPPGQQSEPLSLSSEYLVLKHIGYKILYFLLFVVFCVTLYHYDLIVCFALYLFSLYWLYCEGRKSKEAVKKD
nr:protein phosphatase 1 regulatory subunit 3A isoform X2 [Pogona vitticeps]